MNNLIPMNLQLFAEPGSGSGDGQDGNPSGQGGQQAQVQVDYDKIQKMLDGTLAAKEDTALNFR